MSAELKVLVNALGNPEIPTMVWQAQYDDDGASLKRLGYARPGDAVRIQDLLCYCDDLKYVEELQEGLLLRVLPHLLHAWRAQILKGRHGQITEPLWAGLAKRREFIAKALGPEGTRAAAKYMADALLERMAMEESLEQRGAGASAYEWSAEFVSFGNAWDDVDLLLQPWRAMERTGHALCAVQYLASLIFTGAENPVFGRWTADEGGGPLTLWQNASDGYEERWSDPAVERLRALLAGGGAAKWLKDAAAKLKEHPGHAVAVK
ncbi:MAG: hypothetical protein KGJ84_05260, partial [Elusimicrobia bacterium]|nr:hypothetical protein [Elusimicrobiota bacterium]